MDRKEVLKMRCPDRSASPPQLCYTPSIVCKAETAAVQLGLSIVLRMMQKGPTAFTFKNYPPVYLC